MNRVEEVYNYLDELTYKNKYYYTYLRLVKKANTRIENNGYKEKHHIIPKSIKNIDSTLINNIGNIVTLTPKEHFIAHLLLTKIFFDPVNKKKMNWAFYQLRLSNKFQKRYISSRMYDLVKRQPREFVVLYKDNRKVYIDAEDEQRIKAEHEAGASDIMPDSYKPGRVGNMIGKQHSAETKIKMKESAKISEVHGIGLKNLTPEQLKLRGISSGNTRKLKKQVNPNIYDESNRRRVEKRKEAVRTGQLSFKGANNSRYGATLTEETKRLISVKRQRLTNGGYTHEELFTLFIVPLLKEGTVIKDICNHLPVKKTPYYLRRIILKYSE